MLPTRIVLSTLKRGSGRGVMSMTLTVLHNLPLELSAHIPTLRLPRSCRELDTAGKGYRDPCARFTLAVILRTITLPAKHRPRLRPARPCPGFEPLGDRA